MPRIATSVKYAATLLFAALLLVIGLSTPARADILSEDNLYAYTLVTDENGNTTARLTYYYGYDIYLAIPSMIDDLTVTEVSGRLVENQRDILEKVKWPETVKEIPAYIFDGCTLLRSVDIPTSVTSIGGSAFAGCTSLTSFVIHDGVTSIGSFAFDGSGIETLVVPNSVTNIGASAFGGLKSTLKELTISVETIPDNEFKDCTALEKVTIGSGTKLIGTPDSYNDYVFSGCTSLTSVSLPDTLVSIGSYAFQNCSSLPSIDIPDSVTTIENNVFSGCTSLVTANIGSNVTEIGDRTFASCEALTSIILPEGLLSLGRSVFNGSGLETLVVPSTLTTFSSLSFLGIKSTLKELTISVETIPDQAFNYCTALEKVTIGSGTKLIGTSDSYSDYVFSGCTSLTSLSLPDTLVSIGSYAFQNCSSLPSIDIPDSVTTIENYAFSGCTSLVTANIGRSVTEIGDSAFASCEALTSIILPEGLLSLGSSVFNDSGLETLVVPSTLTTFSSFSFSGIKSTLKELTISVETIPDQAFNYCTALEKVTIGSGTKLIGTPDSYADVVFSGCTSLTSLSLPDTLVSIGSSAFQNCPLSRVYLPTSITTYGSSAFPTTTTLISPENTTTAATLTAAGRAYVTPTALTLPADLAAIEAEAFLGDAAEMVVIPASCTAIGSRAFADMPNLHYVQLPSGTVVAPDAFDGSPVLEFIEY